MKIPCPCQAHSLEEVWCRRETSHTDNAARCTGCSASVCWRTDLKADWWDQSPLTIFAAETSTFSDKV